MDYMFYNCTLINDLDLSNFDTSNVKNMSYMFNGCFNLNFLNITNFNTSNVVDMNSMFYNCESLSSLNLSNFDTTKVNNMNNMFKNCINLNSLNLSSFDTSNVENMDHMFYNCSLINYLDLSNFNITNVQNFNNMFYACSNLEYININSSNKRLSSKNKDMFLLTPENLAIYIENDNYKSIDILEESKRYQCYNSNYEINYICYMKNSSLYNKYICDICEKKLIINYSELNYSNNNSICYESDIKYHNNTELIEDNLINFTELEDNFIYGANISESYFNYYYKNETYRIFNNYSSIFSTEITFNSETNKITREKKNETIQDIIDILIKNFDMIKIDNGKDEQTIEQNKTIILTSTLNQKNNEDKKYISMDLGECEDILKNEYNISKNNSLYILQIISEEEGMKIPKVEYEVYYPLNNSHNLMKLNLSSCKDTKIEISISVKINGSLDKYNPKSDYYNNICSKTTSESGTDISLKDRKNEFVENNMSLCEENCDLIEYDKIKEKVKCSCDVKFSIPSNFVDIKFDKKEFFKSFTDINNIFNLGVMKCYEIVLKVKNLIKNYGSFIVGSIIILYFITLLIL